MSLSRLLTTLSHSQPCIPVCAKNVKVLYSPSEFYHTLLDMIRRAEHRIFLSSLYIGSSEDELLQSLRHSLTSNPRLNLHINLDLLRSTRPGLASTASMLTPLVSSFPDRVHVNLFRSPKLKGLLARLVPRRFDEGWGTWHPKVYGVDDELILSGANLNKAYFTNRQDRYLHFASSSTLANYCFDFLRLMSGFSYRLCPPMTPDVLYTLQWPDTSVQAETLEGAARMSLLGFQSLWHQYNGTRKSDAMVYPMIQAGYLDVRQEEHCLLSFFSELASIPEASSAVLDLTSGYFSLHRPYQDAIISSPAMTRIIAAGPKANGFYGSKGISGRIPEAYTLLEKRFWRRVKKANLTNLTPSVTLSEWEKKDWTYHAKGAWWRPGLAHAPQFTLFGSTNLNSRSANLDTELSFLLFTTETVLRNQLNDEIHNLREHAHEVGESDWSTPERRVRLGTLALVAAGVEGML
ncbi:hypothetical protein BU17DRAFT_76357 [Hysterangium stoloniferum]|nr:hypothetical protein BU17DRAFT_76357 [Hysterangium stoloniferum]